MNFVEEMAPKKTDNILLCNQRKTRSQKNNNCTPSEYLCRLITTSLSVFPHVFFFTLSLSLIPNHLTAFPLLIRHTLSPAASVLLGLEFIHALVGWACCDFPLCSKTALCILVTVLSLSPSLLFLLFDFLIQWQYSRSTAIAISYCLWECDMNLPRKLCTQTTILVLPCFQNTLNCYSRTQIENNFLLAVLLILVIWFPSLFTLFFFRIQRSS